MSNEPQASWTIEQVQDYIRQQIQAGQDAYKEDFEAVKSRLREAEVEKAKEIALRELAEARVTF